MPTAVVTGANSGIGHAFAQVLIREGYDVIAADINVTEKLTSLQCDASQLDVTSPSSIASFASHIGDRPIDLLLNIAGIMLPKDEDALSTVSLAALTQTFAVNTFGPLLLTQALLPNLLRADRAKVGVMSSRVGSIMDNTSGGSYAYRASKSAANSVFKNLAVDLRGKGVAVVIMHPGIVKTQMTDMGRGIPEAVAPEEAAEKLWGVVKGKGVQDTGRFWHREGFELPW
ncbi:short-chain dehydrogenase/reductase family enzyme [Daldinia vernicosa]|uniref:short-chain dehydrogenase/reductase family enzyme n=1 Tax=Daldinia vernicosa TaxID=114800 RepID=UPI00200748AC|nr:short-chain dehydrogenase/reductase family enzyme [Daldinia vernicosa]KAI0850148.1 short-chain dehydrogenase/reductase family enzyme [Daldinia vernicosa]